MSSLSDLYVSYMAVKEPTIEVPKYTPDIPVQIMFTQGKLQRAVQNVQQIFSESPIFKGWDFSNVKDVPKKTAKVKTSEETKAPVLERGTWKAELYAAYKRAGCSDMYARNLVGQDALETGWGQKTVGNYNYGNIKATKTWTGATKSATDIREKSHDAYKSYNSIDEYVADKLKLLKKDYYMTGQETPQKFAHKLQIHGYATASNYEDLVINTIKSV